MLPGEIKVCELEKVFRYDTYSNQKSGQTGTLFITNFKVSFVTLKLDESAEYVSSSCRNKLRGVDDIALANIAEVYQVFKDKKKKLLCGAAVDDVKRLEIYCKDFQFYMFCFHRAMSYNVKKAVTSILHHAFPQRSDLLFAFYYRGEPATTSGRRLMTDYRNEDDWQIELRRLKADNKYKVCRLNCGFKLTTSLPEYFAVPLSLSDSDVKAAVLRTKEMCLPLWSFTFRNSCSLVRVAYNLPEKPKKKLLDVIHSPPHSSPPAVYDLTPLLPSLKDLQTSVDKLRELCIPPSYKELWSSDVSWYSLLETSQWLMHISSVLFIISNIVKEFVDVGKSVVLREASGTDYVPVVSCLVQLALDPHSRTLHGFENLVEREWVALGHQFVERCALTASKDAEQSPVFLLFLDCTWQLLQQFPSAFEFTEIYLTALWDSITLGIFRNFMHSASLLQHKSVHSEHCLSVWMWEKQFDEDTVALFYNPLYERSRKGFESQCWTFPRYVSNPVVSSPQHTGNFTAPSLATCLSASVLRPRHHMPDLHVWSLCYLRWLTPVQVANGGSPAELIAQRDMLNDIQTLQDDIARLSEEQMVSTRRPGQRQQRDVSVVTLPLHVSSSYPFAACKSLHHTTQSGYYTASSVRLSCNDDSISVDELSVSDVSNSDL